MQQTDEQLAVAAKEGDRSAFGELVLRLRGPIIAYITGLLRQREDAEEIAQDVFLVAWQKLETLNDPARISAWVYRIAHNKAVRSVRRPAPSPLLTEPAASIESGPDERLIRLMSIVGDLDETHREVLTRKHFAGHSGEEISRQLGIAPGTVRSRLSRAYAILRERLSQVDPPAATTGSPRRI